MQTTETIHTFADNARSDGVETPVQSEESFIPPQNIFRFKFSNEVMDKIHSFAKIHQFDTRKDYRENWEKWLDENSHMLQTEERRLRELGYHKNIEEKMYKAGRYYFRNKKFEKVVPSKRRKYIPISNEILTSMDKHIKNNIFANDYTPAVGYNHFCETYTELLSQEIRHIIKSHAITGDEMANKIKKTYKNRYFIITHK
tara:strand:- start:342 stop:941 length:600 start_codon:yes stop_codon:yes gene_type:complete